MSEHSSQRREALGDRPIIVFDVNETLLDFDVLAPVFVKISDDRKMLREWFNQVILYSEAQTLAGEYTNSGVVGVAVLEMLAKIKGREIGPDDIAELKRLSGAMPTYADTPAALARLKAGRLSSRDAQQQSDGRRRGPADQRGPAILFRAAA